MKRVDFELTEAQYLEISYLYDSYRIEFRKQLKREMDIFTSAFIARNNIYPRTKSGDTPEHLSPKEMKKIQDIFKRARHMDAVTVRKAINE